jgi:NAD(P)-dependent dehydrogenase (short-subunit alcohol dehydrogenase family)
MAARLLAGRRAAITGGSRGLGAAIGQAFAAEGATIAVLDLPEALSAAGAWGCHAMIACDVTTEAQVAFALRSASETLGGLDIVVANAGLVPP